MLVRGGAGRRGVGQGWEMRVDMHPAAEALQYEKGMLPAIPSRTITTCNTQQMRLQPKDLTKVTQAKLPTCQVAE